MTDMQKDVEHLETAKSNVQKLLNNGNASIDFHGLEYWAGVVERLRDKIKANL